ncbi:signal recognition particle protein Srp54 [Candidatus Woesearchaeota archaeon]|nr:signal recognition particle protein Srp54 [Candidatus Woesearchaeota archaeon]MBW3022119.1 signal recognition particle protein Srp54 [Candidatus Woesearchaeota archaeon]
MVLDKLGSSLKNTLQKIAKSVFVDEKLVNELVKDIQRALLQSDVNVKLVFDLTNSIKKRILKEETPAGLTKKEYLINVVYEELTKFLGEKAYEIDVSRKPSKIMLVGLFGNGKTTTAAKLGKYFQKRAFKVALMSTDTWRPAAYEQLRQLGKQINADVFGNPEEKDPVKIFKAFEPKLSKYDVVIIDTAGRDALSDELIEELNKINKAVQPNETLLVMAADVGQAAQKQAEKFSETCNVTGVMITKLDGTAKGGGALSACSVTKAPVKFIGVGEKIDDLELFNPQRFVGRLLGMGDLATLLEKAKEAISEEEAQDLGKKFLKGKFNLLDLYEQMQAMSKMGPLGKIVEMIPGFSQLKLPKDAIKVQEGKLKKWRFIMDSCTKEELEEPDEITRTRIDRIANGSGCPSSEVRDLLKQYKQAKKMTKMLKPGKMKNMDQMMKKFKGKIPGM